MTCMTRLFNNPCPKKYLSLGAEWEIMGAQIQTSKIGMPINSLVWAYLTNNMVREGLGAALFYKKAAAENPKLLDR